MKKRRFWLVLAIYLILIIVPFLLASRASGSDKVFGGFLLNPVDGNSYLAKMSEGWNGEWNFTLSYSAQPGQGAYLFMYYLLLGHISHWLGLKLIPFFHIARVINSVLMLAAVNIFFERLGWDDNLSWTAFLLAVFASGLGWIAALFGGLFTPDLWVAEAYPFLAAYTNPHFPLAMAMMVWIISVGSGKSSLFRVILIGLAGFCLTNILPFATIIAGVCLVSFEVWRLIERKTLEWHFVTALFIGGAPVAAYQWYQTVNNPSLAIWNNQNQTPSPSILYTLIAFSPAIFLAICGVIYAIRNHSEGGKLLACWALPCLVLVCIPFSLQRRFLTGLAIPLAGLSAYGLFYLVKENLNRFSLLRIGILGLTIPTILLVLLAGLHGIQTRDPAFYLFRGEARAFDWLERNVTHDTVILAAPDTGVYIPAWTDTRVVYGHPFETINATEAKNQVQDYFAEKLSAEQSKDLYRRWGVNYVFVGPRERSLGLRIVPGNTYYVYQSDGVTIYAVQP
jgi:hypothetical protein